MLNIKCENCGKDISSEASSCPACGHPNSKGYCLSIGQQFLFLIIAIGILWAVVMGLEIHFENKKVDVYEQVASDAVEQYNIVKQSGEHAKICLHARIVTAAYLQTNDKAKIQHWKAIEEDECRM
ncbi:MAG: zinc ribbon domain-containing protein [Proteobacteria bacterium]|nr:zinc ribbon domain-containing protein [Pseudomonadota bacterium]